MRIFLLVSFFACILQVIVRLCVPATDFDLWADQTAGILSGAADIYSLTSPYAVPGGPIIIGVGSVHILFGITYISATYLTILVLASLLIGLISILVLHITNSTKAAVVVGIFISCHHLIYGEGTPPSILATLLTIVCFLWLALLSKDHVRNRYDYEILGILLGALVATRIDIGLVIIFSVFCYVMVAKGFNKLWSILLCSMLTFTLLNPYMWYMPVGHMIDLFHRFFFNFNSVEIYKFNPFYVFSQSLLGLISMGLALSSLRVSAFKAIFPKSLLIMLVVLTVFVTSIVFASNYQSLRYLLPVIILWEVMLPLYLLNYLELHTKNRKTQVQSYGNNFINIHVYSSNFLFSVYLLYQLLQLSILLIIWS